jgi:hypothetical protein
VSLRGDGLLLLPQRPSGSGSGRITWAQATYPAVHDFLTNRAYAEVWSHLKRSLANLVKRDIPRSPRWPGAGSVGCSTGSGCSMGSSPELGSTPHLSVSPIVNDR